MPRRVLPSPTDGLPEYVADLNNLPIGSILICRPPKRMGPVQKFIQFMQTLVPGQKLGHNNALHVAVIVGKNERGQVMIAHATENPNVSGYAYEPLQDMLDRDDPRSGPGRGDRPLLVFHPTNPAVADMISKVAQIPRDGSGAAMKWKVKAAASSFFHRTKRKRTVLEDKPFSTSTYCSKFGFEVLQKAAARLLRETPTANVDRVDDVNPASTPRAMENRLKSNPQHYNAYCYLGRNLYQELVNEIQSHITRIGKRTGEHSRRKFMDASKALREVLATNEHDSGNDMVKSLRLVSTMLPVLARRTGIFASASQKAMMKAARRVGLFKKDVHEFGRRTAFNEMRMRRIRS